LDRESKSVDAESPSKRNKRKTSNPRKIIREYSRFCLLIARVRKYKEVTFYLK